MMLKTGMQRPVSWRTYILRLGLLLFCFEQASRAQQTPATASDRPQPAQQIAAQTHPPKIWTNDDVVALRTPMDIYILEKEVRAAAQEAFAVQRLLSCFAFDQPGGTLEETQLEIKSTTQAIQDSQEAVTQARLQLANSPEVLRIRNQLELSRRTAELDERRARLAALQKHLSELNGTDAPTGAAPSTGEPLQAPSTLPD
jgi:hypothetical protein